MESKTNEGKKPAKHKTWMSGPPPRDPNKVYVNVEQEDQMEIQGYVSSRIWSAVIYVCIALTVGLLRLVFHWVPHWYVRATHRKSSLSEATTVILRDQYEQWFVSQIHTITKDGTRVEVLKPSVTFSLTASSRRRRGQLLFNAGQLDDRSKLSVWKASVGIMCTFISLLPLYIQFAMMIILNENKKDENGNGKDIECIDQKLVHGQDENLIRYFMVKKVKYLWDPEEDKYQKLRGLDANNKCSYFHEARGLSYKHQVKRRVLYGVNSIAVHVKPVLVLLFKEALTPFYIFQIFSMTLWYFDEYYYYASCILLISIVSLSATIYQTRKMQRALRNTIQTSTIVTVCRGGDEYQDIPSEDLVPGDMIEIPATGCMMQCDAVLISGNCIVNESMLTGESVPVTKTPIPDSHASGHPDIMFDLKEHAKHTLFCGTEVIQTRYYGNKKVRAVVLRTGFLTSKGELVRAILYPKPVDFKFNRDTYLFVGILALIACIGLVYTVVLKAKRGDGVSNIIKRSLDVITIAVPPALPAALTVGIVLAQRRMKRSGIFCISPRSINICGSINAVCFDKTGTLTEDGLNMQGVVPVQDGEFKDDITNMLLLDRGLIMETMATCHSLTKIDGKLSGDPLDLIMFNSIDWLLEEPGEESSRFDMLVPTVVFPKTSNEHTMNAEQLANLDKPGLDIGIVRQFTFSSNLQRMSVIVRRIAGTQFDLYAKGSPEMITSLCKPETIPSDFHKKLKSYTQHGYRVLGMACRQLPAKYNYVRIQRVHRETVEKDLTFLGLLIMENKLKPETTPIIHQLNNANIRVVMVTGDNILTALSVAHECRMVAPGDRLVVVDAQPPQGPMGLPSVQFLYEDSIGKGRRELQIEKDTEISTIEMEENTRMHFAVTGQSWDILQQHFPEVLSKVLVRGVVFARMAPDQKAQLVEAMQELGYYVGMCGDGANDCGALKMAHAGIALSEAEASVASPFTSKTPNIECVPTVIREGRAALVTSFGIFKYMACYSLTQFISVLILYHINSSLTDGEFLYIDLFLLLTLSVTYGYTEAYDHLVKEPPQLALTSLAPIMSLVFQTVIQLSVQLFCFFYIRQQDWFEAHVPEEEDDHVSYENTAIFIVSMFQYISLAVAFSKGPPYRKSMFTNYLFLVNVVVCMAFSIWITVYPLPWMVDFLEMKTISSIPFRVMFLGVAIANCLLSVLLETFLLDHEGIRHRFLVLKERCCPGFKFEYHSIEEEMVATPHWPPVGTESSCVLYPDNTFPADDTTKETDRMLPDSMESLNYNCSNSSYPSLGYSTTKTSGSGSELPSSSLNSEENSPKTSTAENPFGNSVLVLSTVAEQEGSADVNLENDQGIDFVGNAAADNATISNQNMSLL